MLRDIGAPCLGATRPFAIPFHGILASLSARSCAATTGLFSLPPRLPVVAWPTWTGGPWCH